MNTQTVPVWKATIALIRYRWPFLLINFAGQTFFIATRLIPGLIIQRFFDQLTGAAPAITSLWTLLALLMASELVRVLSTFLGSWGSAVVRNSNRILLKSNIVRNVLERPAALGLPISSGDAIARLDDDTADFGDFPTWLPEMLGHLIFFVAAVFIMAQISLPITLVVIAPLIIVLFINRFAWQRFLYYDRASRDADSRVTELLGELLDSVQAIKVADAQRGALSYFGQLNEVRRRANVRHGLFWAIFRSAADNIGDIAIGVMVVMAAQRIGDGSFTVGDFSLFTTYLFFAARFPAEIGSYISEWAQQRVSIGRMVSIIPDANPSSLVAHQPVGEWEPSDGSQTAVSPLQTLTLQGVTYSHTRALGQDASPTHQDHAPNGYGISGIFDIHFTLTRGSFTVITGPVGAGKSTLLRVLLGLLPLQSGEILWNGQLVANPARFFQPPRTAYTPQVPRLFSDTLRDNLLMGLKEKDVRLAAAITTAVLDRDIATLENGLETVVGPRGVRLSGGQVQRAAAARMFVRQAELLVFDDLSSALDVETEQQLWQNLLTQRADTTFLVVSHRPAVLQQADQVLVLENGRLHQDRTI